MQERLLVTFYRSAIKIVLWYDWNKKQQTVKRSPERLLAALYALWKTALVQAPIIVSRVLPQTKLIQVNE